MSTKLTLTLDKEVIEEAKKYASNKGYSLSEMVANYFKYLTEYEKPSADKGLSPRIKQLKGIVKVSPDFDYKKVLEDSRFEKHG